MNLRQGDIPVVTSKRGHLTELLFRGSVAVVDRSGKLVFSLGDPKRCVIMRSTWKPFQLASVLRILDVSGPRFLERELAIMAGSHGGELRHVETISALFQRVGLSAEDVKCGVARPLYLDNDPQVFSEVRPTPLHHNCSGNHAAILIATKFLLDRDDYLNPRNRVHRLSVEDFLTVTGYRLSQESCITDGCGMPTYALPLSTLALAYMYLARTADHDGIPLSEVSRAMMRNPYFTAGTSRFETELMENVPVVVKIGANGLLCVGVPDLGLGVAAAIESGSFEACKCLIVETLLHLGILDSRSLGPLERFRRFPIHSSAGIQIGYYKIVDGLFA